MTAASPFPVARALPREGGELVQSFSYRETYGPAYSYDPPDRRRLLGDAPEPFRTAAGAAWALVSVVAAGCVLVVLVLLVALVVGVLA